MAKAHTSAQPWANQTEPSPKDQAQISPDWKAKGTRLKEIGSRSRLWRTSPPPVTSKTVVGYPRLRHSNGTLVATIHCRFTRKVASRSASRHQWGRCHPEPKRRKGKENRRIETRPRNSNTDSLRRAWRGLGPLNSWALAGPGPFLVGRTWAGPGPPGPVVCDTSIYNYDYKILLH